MTALRFNLPVVSTTSFHVYEEIKLYSSHDIDLGLARSDSVIFVVIHLRFLLAIGLQLAEALVGLMFIVVKNERVIKKNVRAAGLLISLHALVQFYCRSCTAVLAIVLGPDVGFDCWALGDYCDSRLC